MVFSPLISISTVPDATNFDLANRITITSDSTTAVNSPTPSPISTMVLPLTSASRLPGPRSMRNGDYSWMPENAMKPSAIRPAVMKVMPRPCRPSGTSEYFSFSRTPASAVIASAQPTPEPRP